MVRFVHSTHSQFHPCVAGKWLVWGTLMMLLAGVAIITFNRVPKEGEYLYNRYLPVISMVWVAFLILLVYVVRYCMNKRR